MLKFISSKSVGELGLLKILLDVCSLGSNSWFTSKLLPPLRFCRLDTHFKTVVIDRANNPRNNVLRAAIVLTFIQKKSTWRFQIRPFNTSREMVCFENQTSAYIPWTPNTKGKFKSIKQIIFPEKKSFKTRGPIKPLQLHCVENMEVDISQFYRMTLERRLWIHVVI